jgi:hypothetical protein
MSDLESSNMMFAQSIIQSRNFLIIFEIHIIILKVNTLLILLNLKTNLLQTLL